MKRIYSLSVTALLLLLLGTGGAHAQTTVSTMGGTNYTGGNGVGGNSAITFVVENTSGNPVTLTDVNHYFQTASNGATVTLWYTTSSISGATGGITTPVWTSIATNTISVPANGVVSCFTGLTFNIPNGAQYRFALQSSSSIRYSGATPVPTPSTFTNGGVTLKVGDHQISGSNVGYGGAFPTPPNTARWFTGSITFVAASPCTGAPTPGTATTTSATVCSGAPVTLNLTGHTSGGGQTYQWQTSTTATGTYTNLGTSGTTSAKTINPTTSLYYRAALTCGTSTTFSAPVLITVNNTLAGGTYTIDNTQPTAGTNYNSFTAAAQALRCGITGPVVFNVANGQYNEQIDIAAIPGSSATNRVTFQSASNNATTVNLQFAGTSATDNYVVKLTDTKYITFKGISMTNTGGSFSKVLEMAGDVSYDSVANCILNSTPAVGTSTEFSCIYTTGLSSGNINNVFVNNIFNGGTYGIRWYASSTSLTQGTVIDNNQFVNQTYYACYVYGANDLKYRDNVVNTVNTHTTFYGPYFYYCDNALEVSRNKISIQSTGTAYGMRIYYCDGTNAVRGSVVNNVINASSTGSCYGFYSYYSSYQNYYNNTVNCVGDGLSGYAAYFNHTSATYSNIHVRNNIFSNTDTGYAVYFANDPQFVNSDYNNTFTNGSTPFYFSSGKSLHEWRAQTGQEKNSISYYPGFMNAGDLTPDPSNPAVWSINGRGEHLAGNDRDFNNNMRETVRANGVPDLGAYEFTPTSVPPVAEAIPSAPQNDMTQYFLFGKDTVASINWANVSLLPATVSVRQYTGVKPPQLQAVSPASYTYFYTDIDVPTTTYDFTAEIHYNDSWLGTISSESEMKMVKKFNAYPWIAYNNAASTTDTDRNIISSVGLTSHGYFSGIGNGTLQTAHISLGGKVIFCPGANVRLYANPGSGFSYQWKHNGLPLPGAVSASYLATSAGVYEVEVMNGTNVLPMVPVEVYVTQAPSSNVVTSGATQFCPGNNVTLSVNSGMNTTHQWRLNGLVIPGATNPSYTANSAGVYTVTSTNLGCSSTSPATVLTVGPPSVNLGIDTSYCQSKILVLDAGNPGAKYLWSTGDTTRSISVNGIVNQSYSVRVSTGPSCTADDTINVTVYPLPTVVGISYVRNGNTYQLQPSGAQNTNAYLWIFNDGTTDTSRVVTHSYNSNLPQSVKLIVFNACGADTVETSLTLDVQDIAQKNAQVQLYPNPAQSRITISIEGGAYLQDIVVINNLGQVVYRPVTEHGHTQQQSIDVSNLPNGHYILRASTSEQQVVTKQFDIVR